MPERTEHHISKPNLGQRVEEVLEAIDSTCADLKRQSHSTEQAELDDLAKLGEQAVSEDEPSSPVAEPESTKPDEPEPPERSQPKVLDSTPEPSESDPMVVAEEASVDEVSADEGSLAEAEAVEAESHDPSDGLDEDFDSIQIAMNEIAATMDDEEGFGALDAPDESASVQQEHTPEPVDPGEALDEPESGDDGAELEASLDADLADLAQALKEGEDEGAAIAGDDVVDDADVAVEPDTVAVESPDQGIESGNPVEPNDRQPEDAVDEIEGVLTEAIEEAAAEEESEPEGTAGIEELDEELAGMADELVDGDFEDADGEVAGEVDAAAPVTAAAEVEENTDPLGDPTPIDQATEPCGEPVPEDKPEAQPNDDDDTPPGGRVIEPKSPDRPAWAKGRDAVLALACRGSKAAIPLGARALLLTAKPAAKLPASTRDTVGWLGLYTAFLAVCVWGFLLFFRKPIMPEPTAEPVGISGEVMASTAPADK